MNDKNFDLSLYLVTDERMPWKLTLQRVEAAVNGGVLIVQLREKNSSKETIRKKALDLLQILQPRGIPLNINDYMDVALEVGAQGVHLGQSDHNIHRARSILGKDAIVGLSIESLLHLNQNIFDSCCYLSASPVFKSMTKTDTAPPLGLEVLRMMREQCPIPLIAIGGITLENVSELAGIGIDGIAVVSAILSSDDPQTAAKSLRTKFDTSRRSRPA